MKSLAPENSAQEAQVRESTWRAFNRLLKTDAGERAWLLVVCLIGWIFAVWTGYNWGTNEAATPWREMLKNIGAATYEATVDNRCIGLALMAIDYPDHPLPEWCEESLARVRLKPPPLSLSLPSAP